MAGTQRFLKEGSCTVLVGSHQLSQCYLPSFITFELSKNWLACLPKMVNTLMVSPDCRGGALTLVSVSDYHLKTSFLSQLKSRQP